MQIVIKWICQTGSQFTSETLKSLLGEFSEKDCRFSPCFDKSW